MPLLLPALRWNRFERLLAQYPLLREHPLHHARKGIYSSSMGFLLTTCPCGLRSAVMQTPSYGRLSTSTRNSLVSLQIPVDFASGQGGVRRFRLCFLQGSGNDPLGINMEHGTQLSKMIVLCKGAYAKFLCC